MNKIIALLTLTLFSTSIFAHDPPAGTIAISKATELGVHRIERLVTLKKIDVYFQTALVSLAAEPTIENGATSKVYGYAAPGVDGKSSLITMWQDGQGKTLAYLVGAVSQPANPVTWPAVDAATLMENGLHFVLEGWLQYPELKMFYTGLQTISLSQATDVQGNLLAKINVTSDDDN